MKRTTGQRRGFCPSLWTPMESGDGLLVRVRAGRGARGIDASQLRALVQLAQEHGNGLIEVTRRARLQLRGVRAESLLTLQESLLRLGLGESSANDRRAALIVNPWSGLSDECAPLDVVAEALEAALATSPEFAGLSDKFGVVLDSGFSLSSIAADIHVDLAPAQPDWAELHVANQSDGWLRLGRCRAADVASCLIGLVCILRASGDKQRMRDVVASQGLFALQEQLGALLESSQRTAARHVLAPGVGFHRGAIDWLELGIAFGSAEPETWLQIADLAERSGTSEIRFTPFRSLILPSVTARDHDSSREAGWIVDPTDPLLRVMACPGAPACRSGHGETRVLARRLAPLLAAGELLHVSGCAKGCAHSGASDVTVVRKPEGCALAFGRSAAETAESDALSLDALRTQLSREVHTRTQSARP
jgi:precorrin-3B synthase